MKLLPLPKEFDQNEWFVIVSFLILIILLLFMPKRFLTSITILILIFSVGISRVIDHTIAGPNINFYDVMDTGDYELFDLLVYITYAPFAYLFVYFYDKYKLHGLRPLLYIVICSLGGIGVEWITTKYLHVFHYKDWNLLYSLNVYLIIQPATLLFYRYVKMVHDRSRNHLTMSKEK